LADFSDTATTSSQTAVTRARSLGLLTKSATTSTAQTATMLASGVLSLYYVTTATVTALAATGGTFTFVSKGITPTMNQTRTTALFGATATGVGQLWTAPSTAGTYTISLYSHGAGAVPTLDTPAGTLASAITVTVVAASAGGKYDASESFCAISNTGTNFALASNVDSTAATVNGGSMYINFALNDTYGNNLTDGNIVVTATGGANVAYADGSAVTAGTSGTAVAYDEGAGDSIRVTQGTADAPTSSTVTISYNGTVVCTKTVGFAGAPSKVAVTVVETQSLSTSAGKTDFLADGYARTGLFTVLLTDAAGNQVQAAAGDNGTTTIGTFSVNAA
jgi:prepilin-type processing-associated H-X9-DG protein